MDRTKTASEPELQGTPASTNHAEINIAILHSELRVLLILAKYKGKRQGYDGLREGPHEDLILMGQTAHCDRTTLTSPTNKEAARLIEIG